MSPMRRRRPGTAALLAGILVLLSGCTGDGNLCILGYTTRPNYDTSIKTIHVPIFKNLMQGAFRRGLEFDLTTAVIRQIELITPYKVVSDPCHADTELTGTIMGFQKNLVNINPENEIREAETTLTIQLVWRDLRTGEILSQPKRPPGAPPLPPPVPGAPLPPAPPVVIQSTGDFVPELGGSLTTAQQQNINRLAIQIVSMMEIPW